MPKESGPQPGGMSRREFLKRTPQTMAVVAGVGTVAEAEMHGQETQKVLDNSAEEIVNLAIEKKILYPETFKPINQEISGLLLEIQKYQSSFHFDTETSFKVSSGKPQSTEMSKMSSAERSLEIRRLLFAEYKKINPTLGEYSDKAFYQVLAYDIPALLAEYGIYAKPVFVYARTSGVSDSPAKFLKTEILSRLAHISRVDHSQIEKDGTKVDVPVLYIDGSIHVDGVPVSDEVLLESGETGFGNVVIFESKLQKAFAVHFQSYKNLRIDLGRFPELTELKKRSWAASNQMTEVAQGAMLRLIKRVKSEPSYQKYKDEMIVHETWHLIDEKELGLRKAFPVVRTSNVQDHEKRSHNVRIHQEINPMLSQLRCGQTKEMTLINFINIMKDVPSAVKEIGPIYPRAAEWIIRNMIDLISQDPDKYGIELSADVNVSTPNQILGQLDVLLDRPELFNELCEKLIELHKVHIADDLNEVNPLAQQQNLAPKPEESLMKKTLEYGALGVGVGAAAYGAKKYMERTKEVAKERRRLETMSRQDRRKADREKKNKGK